MKNFVRSLTSIGPAQAIFSCFLAFAFGCSNSESDVSILDATVATTCGLIAAPGNSQVSEAGKNLQFVLKNCDGNVSSASPVFVKTCIDKTAAALPASSQECRNEFGPQFRAISRRLLEFQINSIPTSKTLEDSVERSAIFAAIDNFSIWFKYGSALYDKKTQMTTSDPGTFQGDFLYLSSKFWDRLNIALAASALKPGSNIASLQSKFFQEAFAHSAEIGTSELAVSLIYPYLNILAEKGEVLGDSYDLSCKLSKCNSRDSNSRSQFIRLLASFPNEKELKAAIDSANLVPSHIVAFFKTIQAYHKNLVTFLTGSEGRFKLLDPSFSSAPWEDQKRLLILSQQREETPLFAFRIVQIAAKFIEKNDNFKASGSFSKAVANRLDFGPSEDAISSIKDTMTVLDGSLTSAVGTYKDSRIMVLDQIANSSAGADAKMYQADSARISQNIANTFNDIENLKLSLTSEEARKQEFLYQIATLKNGQFSQFVPTDRDVLPTSIKAADAVYVAANPNWTKLSEVTDATKAYVAKTDSEILDIGVTNTWSPRCAIKKDARLASYADESLKVGSEGYQLSLSNGTANVSSKSSGRNETSYTDQSLRNEVCMSQNTSAGVGANVFVVHGDSTTSMTVSNCLNYQVGKRVDKFNNSSDTSSSSSQRSANFAAGLRLENTPFPEYPAGALLAVTSSGTERTTINDVSVVERQSRIILRKNDRLTLVINDCKDPSISSGTLAIQANVSKNEGTAAASILSDFMTILTDLEIRKDSENLELSGVDISAGLLTLRSKILKKMSFETGGGSSSGYQNIPVLRDLFNFWLDSTMEQISRKQKIFLLRRQLQDLDTQLRKSNLSYIEANEKTLVQGIILQEMMGNLDFKLLEKPLGQNLNFMSLALLPLINLYFPQIDLNDEFADINQLPIDADFGEIAQKISKLTAAARSEIQLAKGIRDLDPRHYDTLMIQIPKPEVQDLGGFSSGVDGDIPVANAATRVAFWQKLRGTDVGPFRFAISPEDLYQDRVSHGLSCSQTLPIVVSTALGFALKPEMEGETVLLENLNGRSKIVSTIGPKVDFVTKSGMKSFLVPTRTLNAAQVTHVPVVFGASTSSTFEKFKSRIQIGDLANAGFGFSPFSEFKVEDLAQVRDQNILPRLGSVENIDQAFLIFYVKFDATDAPQPWISRCN